MSLLHDLGLVPFAEPFPVLRHDGMIGLGGAKMSKSRGNVVVPDDYVARVGADALRTYLLFLGPWDQGGEFSDAGFGGAVLFLRRAWATIAETHRPGAGGVDVRALDRAIARVTEDCERCRFNTAIAALMELLGWMRAERGLMSAAEWARCARAFTVMLAPFAPHLAEEPWARLGGPYSVHAQPWPSYDPAALAVGEVTIVVQVDGRARDRFPAPATLGEEEARRTALAPSSRATSPGARCARSSTSRGGSSTS